MGYTTDFDGEIAISPPLNAEEIKFIQGHNKTRRMKRSKGPYYISAAGNCGQEREEDIIDYNSPPEDKLSLWCGWTCNDEGTCIVWDGNEKFYQSVEWMKWLIDHILGSNPLAKPSLPFLQGHTLNGQIKAQGEEPVDRWKLVVENNVVKVAYWVDVYTAPEAIHQHALDMYQGEINDDE